MRLPAEPLGAVPPRPGSTAWMIFFTGMRASRPRP
jgi:hypothetical protein